MSVPDRRARLDRAHRSGPGHIADGGWTAQALGQVVSPDDASLALRGLRTMSLRLERETTSVMALAQWLDARWSGVWAYIAPLVLWQGCACLSAAFSHRPFQTQSATMYSWLCMGLALAQGLVLLAPLVFGVPLSAADHVSGFALVSSLGLLGVTAWMAKLR